MNRIKRQITPREDQFEPVWEEEQDPAKGSQPTEIVLRDILMDALREF